MKRSNRKRSESPTAGHGRLAQEERKPGRASPAVLMAGFLAVVALLGGTFLVLMRSSPTTTESPVNASLQESATSTPSEDSPLVSAATSGHDPYPLAVAENGAVRFPVSTFDDQQAHYYTYMHNGRPIEFFVLKSKDGVVRAAFNACMLCFQSLKGYRHDGDQMVCNNCGQTFPTDQINEIEGGCNPLPLDRAVVSSTLVIQAEDIISGLEYFPSQAAAQTDTSPSEVQRPTPTGSVAQTITAPTEVQRAAPTSGVALTITSPSEVQRITAADAKVLLDRGEGVLYDVRTAGAYEAKHALGAISFPESELESLLDTLPADKALIFYCT